MLRSKTSKPNHTLPMAAALLASGLYCAGASAANVCDRYVAAPDVVVQVDDPSMRYVPTPLQILQVGVKDDGSGVVNLGHTNSYGGSVTVDTTFAVQEIPDGFCVTPQVRTRYTGEQIDIHLPKEIPVEHCLYKETMAYERSLVSKMTNTRREHLELAAQRMRSRISSHYAFFQRLADAKPWLNSYQREAQQAMTEALANANAKISGIDSTEAMRKIAKACTVVEKRKWWQWAWN